MKMPPWPIPQGSRPIDLDLSRIESALEPLGRPQEKLPPVIHIAGTNGKGSTLAFAQAIFEAAGYSVHKYTSPHLLEFNERIVLNGKPIDDDRLTEVINYCRSRVDDIPLTFFEGTTAAALVAFAENPADILLLETGLGGRLDATNVIDKPLLTAISSVSYDHMEYLGPTLSTIAGEKAGIIKPNVPVIIGYQYEESQEVLEQIAAQKKAPMFRYGHEWSVERLKQGFAYREGQGGYILPTPSLKGPHQILNAGMAIAIAECAEGFLVSEEHIKQGITHTHWPARMESITRGPLTASLSSGWQLWLDGAHNEAASQMLAITIEQELEQAPLYAIVGMTKGRNVEQFLTPLKERIAALYTVRVESEPSAYTAEEIKQKAASLNLPTHATPSIEAAIQQITQSHPPGNILICGSLYLAGDVKEYNQQ